jgi:hypothetical protein
VGLCAGEEQFALESYYTSASSGNAYYYIGLEKVGNLWYWYDGASAGNGQPGNANPYAHWWVLLPAVFH